VQIDFVTSPNNMPLSNYAANKLFAVLARVILRTGGGGSAHGMRAYRKELIQSFEFDANGMALPVELVWGQ